MTRLAMSAEHVVRRSHTSAGKQRIRQSLRDSRVRRITGPGTPEVFHLGFAIVDLGKAASRLDVSFRAHGRRDGVGFPGSHCGQRLRRIGIIGGERDGRLKFRGRSRASARSCLEDACAHEHAGYLSGFEFRGEGDLLQNRRRASWLTQALEPCRQLKSKFEIDP
jgi:hypothetical protein